MGRCCCVKNAGIVAIGFAAMNIALFGALLLICSRDYHAQARKVKFYRELKEASSGNSGGFLSDSTLNLYQSYAYSLIAAIIFCLFGIIAGILLLFAPTMKNKAMILAWIIFECIALLVVLVTGGNILSVDNSIRNPPGYTRNPAEVDRFNTMPFSGLLLLCCSPFFLWSIIAIFMSMNDIVSGTSGDGQQGQMYGQQGQFYGQSNQQMQPPSNQQVQSPSNQQMQPQYGGYPNQPQLYQMPMQQGQPPPPPATN